MIAAAGWWVLIVQLWPASSCPYIGGSTDNSVLGLAFGYNGLSRITGDSGAGPGGGGGGGFGGATGSGRLFNSEMGTQISWLIPAALVAIVLLLAVSRRSGRTDRTRNATVLWAGWFLVTAAVARATPRASSTRTTRYSSPTSVISALVAIGAVTAWRHRSEMFARVALAAGTAVTAWWSFSNCSAGRRPGIRRCVA